MMSEAYRIQPPRVAAWLVELFTPNEEAESLQGDLLEEFLDLASKSGVPYARHWYWLQSMKAVAYLILTGIRLAPFRLAGAVLIGFLLILFGLGLPGRAIVSVLCSIPVHADYYELWMVWVPLALGMVRMVMSFFIGCIVAVAAKGREMIATIALGLLYSLDMVIFVGMPRHENGFMQAVLITVFAGSISIAAGGLAVRKVRSRLSPDPSAA
jgi:hypothetical protein